MMPDEEFELKDDDEMQFHYFKIHDHDNDNKMDGLELGTLTYTQGWRKHMIFRSINSTVVHVRMYLY